MPRSSRVSAPRSRKRRYLQPLLDGEIVSCYSMTEPQAGADPAEFTCAATLDGDEWVINGEKWFASHALLAEFLIVMTITNPDVPVHEGSTMIIVPAGTAGDGDRPQCRRRPARRDRIGVHGYIALLAIAGCRGKRARPGRRGLQGCPVAARRRPHPPRDANRRDAQQGDGNDGASGSSAGGPRASGWPTSRWCRKRSPTATRKSCSSACTCFTPPGCSTRTRPIRGGSGGKSAR